MLYDETLLSSNYLEAAQAEQRFTNEQVEYLRQCEYSCSKCIC